MIARPGCPPSAPRGAAIMPARPEPAAAPGSPLRASGLARIAGFTVVMAVALFCVILLAVRFVLFPQIASHRLDIAAMLSRELGANVEIDTIRTGWQGWNPEIVVSGFRVRSAATEAGDAGQPQIELPEVRGVVSWTSLLTADLRFRELVIERALLAARRDAAGRFHIAGLRVDASQADGPRLTNWLLRQPSIVIRDALLTWEDAFRNTPQLILDGVQFRLERSFGQHRFGLRGTPPPEIAAPIDVRGELSGGSVSDWRNAAGRVYLRLDFADVAAWSEWISLPVTVQSGQGAMRVWFEFADGVARDVVADLELADVRTQLANDLPALELAHLAGRVTWRQDGAQRSLSTRALAFAERDGVAIEPTNLDIRYAIGSDGSVASGRIASSRIDLRPLSQLASQLPLPADLRVQLARHAPQGTLSDFDYAWQGTFAAPSSFSAQGAFAGLGTKVVDTWAGFSGLSGRFDATQAAGTIHVASRNAVLTMPKLFAEPIALDSASGRVRWERPAGEISVRFDEVQFANAHTAGTAQGTWKSSRKGPGDVDLAARLSRADVKQVHRYLPLVMGAETRTWLRDSLVAGAVDDASMPLKGDLSSFPFPEGRSGTFLLTINTRDATLDYVTGWPPVAGMDAQIRLEGQTLGVTASRGRVLGATLGPTTAKIADLSLWHPVLVVEGEASGPTSEFLSFITSSPVGEWIDHATEKITAAGNGKLELRFEGELGKEDGVPKVQGAYHFADNQLRLPGAPALTAVNGRLAFTGSEVTARDVAVESLGGPARVSVTSGAGVMKINASGNAALAAVHREFDTPLAARFTGSTDWQLALETRNGFAAWTLESSLRGAAIDLPRPARKTAGETMPLKIERRALATSAVKDVTRDAIVVDLGGAGRVVAHRKLDASGGTVDRALVLLGSAAQPGASPERSGVVVRGNVDALNVEIGR